MPELDLLCRKNVLIGLFGSLFFAGFMLGALCITPLADKFGRKTIVLISHVGSISGFVVMGVWHNLYARYVGVFIVGLWCSPRGGNSFILMHESVPEKYQPWVFSALSANEAVTLIWGTVYFYYISKDWQYWIYFTIGYSIVCLFVSFFVFESTKYYLSHGRYDDARTTFSGSDTRHGDTA